MARTASSRQIILAKGYVSVDCSTDPEFADLAAIIEAVRAKRQGGDQASHKVEPPGIGLIHRIAVSP